MRYYLTDNNMVVVEDDQGSIYCGILTENDRIVWDYDDKYLSALVENSSQGIVEKLTRALNQSIERDPEYRRLLQESDQLDRYMKWKGSGTDLTKSVDLIRESVISRISEPLKYSDGWLCEQVAIALDIPVKNVLKYDIFLNMINGI